MSRSLGAKALHKKKAKARSPEAAGRALYTSGQPCPSGGSGRGKQHAMRRGWMRAAAEDRTRGKL